MTDTVTIPDANTRIYTTPDGTTYTYSGGDLSWRNNNPGNLHYGDFAIADGAIGQDANGFAIFPDAETGEQALRGLVSGSYGNDSINAMMSAYAPSFENNTSAYQSFLAKSVGVPGTTVIGKLTPTQFEALIKGIETYEGTKAGTITAKVPANAGGSGGSGTPTTQTYTNSQIVTFYTSGSGGHVTAQLGQPIVPDPNEPVVAPPEETSDYYGANDGWGDEFPGTSGDGYGGYGGGGGGGVGGGGDPGGGYYGYYGLSGNSKTVKAALGKNIGQIASTDISNGNASGALAAEAGQRQASQEAALFAAKGAIDSPILEAAHWDQRVITWSWNKASGALNAAEETDVRDAFSAWAKATGIQFVETSGSGKADINLGWANLNSASSGVAGYTTLTAAHGQVTGANIQIDGASIATANGSANGDVQFSQVLEHEIGHAIGLADDADPNSVMFYQLTGSNRTLDSTDLAGAKELYGSTSTQSDLSLLNQALSSFGAAASAQTTSHFASNSDWELKPLHLVAERR
jgi:hypothetical protein